MDVWNAVSFRDVYLSLRIGECSPPGQSAKAATGQIAAVGVRLVFAALVAFGLTLTVGYERASAQTGSASAELVAMSPVSVAALDSPEAAEAYSCPLKYQLPGDIGIALPSDNSNRALDEYSWKTFLALNAPGVNKRVNLKGDNKSQWGKWSSTVAVIQCARDPSSCVCPDGNCLVPGARYYPKECEAIKGYKRIRVLSQLSKVDDSFLQATQGGLSNSPLIDSRGKFLRFEILASPVTQKYVVNNKFYDPTVLDNLTKKLKFPCGKDSYTGGNPSNRRSGSYVVKNAWMQLPNDARGIGFYNPRLVAEYHTEELLVYTPSYRNKSGVATCEKRLMALVGQHIAHKTVKQARWTWSTFEHRRNAPDCTALPPPGVQTGAGPSTACPASVNKSYNFYPKACSADGSDPDACQTCNAAPVSNRKGCKNPSVTGDTSWCLDKPPAAESGTSLLCRQVAVAKYYKSAHKMNKACSAKLGEKSVWSNYQLIGTQYYNKQNNRCETNTSTDRGLERPQVPIAGRGGAKTTPYLANTSMESDIRSNCMGCHTSPTVGTNSVSTDFMYWIQLEAADTGSSDAALARLLARSPH